MRNRFAQIALISLLSAVFVVVPAAGQGTVGGGSPDEVTKEVNPAEQTNGDVVISPANQRIPVTKDGETIKTQVILANRTGQPQVVSLQVGQVVGSARAEDVIEIRHGVREGAAAWVELAASSVELKKNETATVPVTIRVPKGVKPGDQAFAVSATQQSTPEVSGSGAVPIYRLTSIFGLEIPGDAKVEVTVTKADVSKSVYVGGDPEKPVATIQYKNTGDRFVKPSGEIVVKPIFGASYRYEIPEFTVYPDGANGHSERLKNLPYMGFVTVTAKLSNDVDEDDVKLGTVWILPSWWKWAAGALAIFLLWQGFRLVQWWRYRDLEWDFDEDDPEADEDDEFTAIVDADEPAAEDDR